jgi:two-component system, OmpR family, sensor histidine kinase TctE
MTREQPLLRTQLLKWLLVPLCALLTADTFFSYWMALRFSQRAYDRSLIELVREVSLHLSSSGSRLEFDLPDAARSVLFTDPTDTVYYGIATSDGHLVSGQAIPPPPPGSGPKEGETLYDGEMDRQRVRVVELRVAQPLAGNGPDAIVRIAETKNKRDELAREILLSVVVPQVVLILIASAIVWFGVVRGLAPLERLEQAIAQRSHRDRRPLEVGTVPGEVKPLMQEINALLERIDSILTLQNRFIADAAHQLKTPVAAVQAQLELAMRDDDPARVRASLNTVHAGLQRLARIVSQLLALARNEPEAVNSIKMLPVDLNALAFECAGEWVREALNRRIDLGFEGTEVPVVVNGDAARLRELLDNLVDNAVRYSSEGGHVTVRVCAEPRPTVAVSDDGPGIPAEEQTLIFERFHRRLGTPAEGSGLGLAIAQEIAQVHGGEICLYEDADGIGNTFALTLPSSDSAAPQSADGRAL